MASVACAGFNTELIDFLGDLETHHYREWFQAHRADYEEYPRCVEHSQRVAPQWLVDLLAA